jgi:hypothetical protein
MFGLVALFPEHPHLPMPLVPHLAFALCIHHSTPLSFEQFVYLSPTLTFLLTYFDFNFCYLLKLRYRFQMYKRAHVLVQ